MSVHVETYAQRHAGAKEAGPSSCRDFLYTDVDSHKFRPGRPRPQKRLAALPGRPGKQNACYGKRPSWSAADRTKGPLPPLAVPLLLKPRNLLHRLGAKASISKRVHPHGLRHTFAWELERAGTPVTVISALLGHSSVAVTARYQNHLTNHQAVTALAAADLPGLDL
jgi:integrase